MFYVYFIKTCSYGIILCSVKTDELHKESLNPRRSAMKTSYADLKLGQTNYSCPKLVDNYISYIPNRS